jgi:hypothetical protein
MRLAAAAAASVSAMLLRLLSDLFAVHQGVAECSVYNANAATIKLTYTLAFLCSGAPGTLRCCCPTASTDTSTVLYRASLAASVTAVVPKQLSHLFAVHQGVAECSVYDAHAAALKQMHALALARGARQLAQLLDCCCVSAGLALFVVVEIDEKARQGPVKHLGVRIPAIKHSTQAISRLLI